MGKMSFCFLLGLIFSAPLALQAQTNGSDLRQMGEALYQRGLYDKAMSYFNNAVQADSNDWRAYQDLGDTYMKLNETSEALNAYNKSLQINPDNAGLKATVENLQASTGVSSQQDQTNFNALQKDHPAVNPSSSSPDTRTIVERRPWGRAVTKSIPNDHLAPMDHARVWTKFELGYDNSRLGELTDSANAINSGTYYNPATELGNYNYFANAIAPNGGFNLGAELGFLLDVNNGLALGVRYVQTNDYTANITYQNSYSDYQDLTLSSYIVPITLDYYFFIPDGGGRFFLSAGAGYYVGVVHVDETVSYANYLGNTNAITSPDEWTGDLTSGNIGFQVGVGREFAVSPTFGIELFARGRLVKISNYRGTLYDSNGNGMPSVLATGTSSTNNVVDVDEPQYVNSGFQEKLTTIDYTGFDVGIALNWYTF